jgi:hypothetical protein
LWILRESTTTSPIIPHEEVSPDLDDVALGLLEGGGGEEERRRGGEVERWRGGEEEAECNPTILQRHVGDDRSHHF